MVEHQGEECCVVPPGFRFHPTEEELVGYYLARKVARSSADHHDEGLGIIQELDLYRIEPWDLQERCKLGGGGDGHTPSEWYFFSYKDRKYPSGSRTNRATAAGFWKATGRDKPVLSSSGRVVIGMRKTLVFYKGRAPNGSKTDWIMHEYRLQPSSDHYRGHQDQEGWVVCRAFQKPIPNQRPFFPTYDATPAGRYHHYLQLQPGGGSALHAVAAGNSSFVLPPQLYYSNDDDHLLESKKHLLSSILPPLESPTAAAAQQRAAGAYAVASENDDDLIMIQGGGGGDAAAAAGAIDWNFLDTLLSTTTSQLLEPSTTLLQ